MHRTALLAATLIVATLSTSAEARRHSPQRNIIDCDLWGCRSAAIAGNRAVGSPEAARRYPRAAKRGKAHSRKAAARYAAKIEARTPGIPLPRPAPGVSRETIPGTLDAYRQAIARQAEVAPVRPGFAEVRTASGHRAVVAAGEAWRFVGFLRELEKIGYRVKDLGGYAYRRIAGTRMLSKHAFGLAIDINQLRRNVVSVRMPAGVSTMASRWGLKSGGDWRGTPDLGHFEVEGRWPARGRHYRRYASR